MFAVESQTTPRCASLGQFGEAFAGLFENRGLAGCALEAANDDVHKKRIELDSMANAAGALGGNEGGARPVCIESLILT
jgi:hypothetical protein